MLCQLIQYLQSQTKKKSGKPHETTMNNQGGEPEWGSLAPVKYPSEARAVRVNNREVKQKCSKLLNFYVKNLLKFLRVPKRKK